MSRFQLKIIFSVFLLINLLPFYNNLSFNKPFYEFADLFQDAESIVNRDLPETWWNLVYKYRAPVVIQNVHTRAIPSGYTVSVSLDTANLTSSGKLRADGNDLRVVWYNATNDMWMELARINETNFNKNQTELWFKTVRAIPPNTVDNDYFLYYGCETPGEPPSDKKLVFKKFDDFTQIDGPAEGWIVIQGAGWGVINKEYRKNKSTGFSITILPDVAIEDAIIELSLKSNGTDFGIGLVWQYKNKAQFYATLLGYDGNELIIGKMSGEFSILKLTGNPESGLVPNKWYKLKVHVANQNAFVYLDDNLKLNATDNNFTDVGSIGLITWTENCDSYFDNLVVQLDGSTPPVLMKGAEESILPSPGGGPDGGMSFVIFIPVGVAIAASAMGIVVVVTKRRHGPKRKRIPLKLVIDHLKQFRDSKMMFAKLPQLKKEYDQETDEELGEKVIQSQIDEIYKLGAELFAEGAYLEVVNHYNQASLTILKYGYTEEADKFSQRAKEIKDLIDERIHKLNVLEIHKLGKKWKDVVALYYEIIRLSKQLNDSDAVEMYQTELDHLDVLPEPEPEEVQLTITSSIHDEIQKFAIHDLEKKRQKFDKTATFLEGRSLFSAAAFFYKKCEAISQQIVRLGKSEERSNLRRYREKKVDCANRNSVDVGETEA